MRGRYKAWAKPFLESHAEFCVPRVEPADPFYDHRPLCLEIGIGKGDFILGYSELFPEGHYLGLERDVSIMGMAAKKVEEAGRTNIRLCAEDFDDLYEGLSKLSFDVIFLNFSDPWPKKRHEKRRLTFRPRLERILALLRQGGELRIKTDNDILYPFTLEQIEGLPGVKMIVNEPDYVFDPMADCQSEYERNFRAKGQKIHRIILRKE